MTMNTSRNPPPTGPEKTIDPVGAGFAIGLPLLAAAVTIGLTALWQDQLPAQIATHWGSGPEPGLTLPGLMFTINTALMATQLGLPDAWGGHSRPGPSDSGY